MALDVSGLRFGGCLFLCIVMRRDEWCGVMLVLL